MNKALFCSKKHTLMHMSHKGYAGATSRPLSLNGGSPSPEGSLATCIVLGDVQTLGCLRLTSGHTG